MEVSMPEPTPLLEITETSATPANADFTNDEISSENQSLPVEENNDDVAHSPSQSNAKISSTEQNLATCTSEMISDEQNIEQSVNLNIDEDCNVPVGETNQSINEFIVPNKSTSDTKLAPIDPEIADIVDESASFYIIPDDISKTPEEGPTQPKLESYPKTPIGGPGTARSRSFCSNWFNRFPWLEYSISNDKVYCFACRHYGAGLYRPSADDSPNKKIPLRKGATIYATIGFSRWAKAHERMQRHNSSARHLEAMGPWLEDTLNRERRNSAANGTELSENSQAVEKFKELEKAAAVAIVNTKPLPSKRKRSRPTKKAIKYNAVDFDPALGCPTWCNCTKCIEMSRMHECVCCCDVPEIRAKIVAFDSTLVCITDHPGFAAICLNGWAVQVAYYHHKQESGTPAVSEDHERFRYIAYCQFVRWCWGYLREDMHIPLPSCVVNKIKATFHSKAELPPLDDLPDASQVIKD